MPRLYRNQGNGTFADVTKQTKLDRVILPMGANYGDLDNDGWLDCYFGTGTPQFEALLPNKMFRNAEGRVFQDVTTSGGFGHLQKGHAVSFGDLDHDGDQDIFEVIGGALAGDAYQSVLFENPGHGSRWLTLELTGERENRSAIGVRVRVRVKTKEGTRDIHRTISSGGSFGASPFRLHVGLGDAVAVDEIEIRWPVARKTQLLRRGWSLDRYYRLREGESQPAPVESKRFSLSAKSRMEPHRHY
ncbi:MAG: CRTAC1 family protein [Acidobacteriota bacterium]|nr:CRTAC1 family protein [Acidobacteriota bacterium]